MLLATGFSWKAQYRIDTAQQQFAEGTCCINVFECSVWKCHFQQDIEQTGEVVTTAESTDQLYKVLTIRKFGNRWAIFIFIAS